MYLYDLAPDQLIQSERPLDVDEIADARDRLERGQSLGAIARRFGATPYEAARSPVVRVGVDAEELERLLERAYPDESERQRMREAIARG